MERKRRSSQTHQLDDDMIKSLQVTRSATPQFIEDYEEGNTQTDNYDGCDQSSPLPPLEGKRAWIVLLGLV